MKMTAGKKDEDYKDQKDQLEPFEKLKKNEEHPHGIQLNRR